MSFTFVFRGDLRDVAALTFMLELLEVRTRSKAEVIRTSLSSYRKALEKELLRRGYELKEFKTEAQAAEYLRLLGFLSGSEESKNKRIMDKGLDVNVAVDTIIPAPEDVKARAEEILSSVKGGRKDEQDQS